MPKPSCQILSLEKHENIQCCPLPQLFPLGCCKPASHGCVEDFLKEIQYLEALQQIRPNAMSLPKLLDALEHKIQATGSMTPSSLLKLTST